MISRAQRTPFGEWWWTVDRLTLAAIGALMLAGIVLSLAASPPVAARLGLDPFFFVNRHIIYVLPAIAVMLSVSFLSPRQIRRLSLMIFFVSLVMVAATPYFGPEIKGARRWLVLLGVNIQPSEFLKPAFLHGRDAARLGCRDCGTRRDRSAERVLHGATCGAAHSALPRSGLGRYLQHRYRHRKLHAWRLVRQRPRRGYREAHSTGESYRLRVRGCGRGIRGGAMPRPGSAVCLRCHSHAYSRDAQR